MITIEENSNENKLEKSRVWPASLRHWR